MEAFLGAFGGVWLALFVIIFALCGAWSAAVGSLLFSTTVVILGVSLLDVLFSYDVFAYMLDKPLSFVGILVAYITVGSAYVGLWRWPDFIRKQKDRIWSTFSDWTRRKELKRDEASFEIFLDSADYRQYWHPSNKKESITTWIIMWPFALLWELSHKPLIWISNKVYYGLGDVFVTVGKNTARKNIKF